MKSFFQLLWLLVGFLISPAANCASAFRAHLEVNVYNGSHESTIRTAANVKSNTPLVFNIGNQRLSLLFSIKPAPSDGYDLTISLSSLGTKPQALNTPLFKQVFHSRLVSAANGPLEFEGIQDSIKVSGTIALSRVPE